MKPFQFILCATLMAGPVLYVVMTQPGSPLSTPKTGRERKAALETPQRMSQLASQANQIPNWPPVAGQIFPEVELFDHHGQSFELSSLLGKPTVIEFISMTCAGCQAFAGGNQFGPYGDLAVQPNLESFDKYYQQYTGFDLHSGELNYVVVVVYNDKLTTPTPQDLTQWRNHFQLNQQNTYIISGQKLASERTFKMIPGFMLLDENQVVQFDSTGRQPKHNLYSELLPAVPKMLNN